MQKYLKRINDQKLSLLTNKKNDQLTESKTEKLVKQNKIFKFCDILLNNHGVWGLQKLIPGQSL